MAASETNGIEPREYRLRPGAFADLRLQMDHDISIVLKSVIQSQDMLRQSGAIGPQLQI